MKWTNVPTQEEYEENKRRMAKALSYRRRERQLFFPTVFLLLLILPALLLESRAGWDSPSWIVIALIGIAGALGIGSTLAGHMYWNILPPTRFVLLTCPSCQHEGNRDSFLLVEYLICPDCMTMAPEDQYQQDQVDVKY